MWEFCLVRVAEVPGALAEVEQWGLVVGCVLLAVVVLEAVPGKQVERCGGGAGDEGRARCQGAGCVYAASRKGDWQWGML